jgi:hypothetical protein
MRQSRMRPLSVLSGFPEPIRERRVRLALVTMLSAALVTSGCSSAVPPVAEPSPIPSATPTATPDAEPSPHSLVIAGREARVLDEQGAQLDILPYSADPTAAIAFLSELLASPPVMSTLVNDQNCVGDATVAKWDDGLTLAYGDLFHPEGQRFLLSARVPSVREIIIATPSGVSVGDPIERLQVDIPVEQRQPTTNHEGVAYDSVAYDVAAGRWVPRDSPEYDTAPYWGASALGVDALVERLVAPVALIDAC